MVIFQKMLISQKVLVKLNVSLYLYYFSSKSSSDVKVPCIYLNKYRNDLQKTTKTPKWDTLYVFNNLRISTYAFL